MKMPKSARHFYSGILLLWVIAVSGCSPTVPTQAPSESSVISPQLSIPDTSTSAPITPSLTQQIVTTYASPLSSTTKSPTLLTPSQTQINTPTPMEDTRLTAYYWRNWPVIPTLSAQALQVFKHGQELGNDLHAFSRIGDCQSVPAIFLGIYDTDRYWFDPEDTYLQSTINQFLGSFQRENITAKDGFGISSVLTPLMSDPKLCQPTETPLDCEYRLHKPIIAFIAMGTNWKPNASASFERYLRLVVEFSIEHGVIPVMVTKADNIETNNLLNVSIAQVAYDYDMPLFNAWAAVQRLPNHGLEGDKIYLTTEAWDIRTFAGLKVLDAIWTSLKSELVPGLSP